MTSRSLRINRWLVVLVMLLATSAWASPCIICAGCGGGWVRTRGAPAEAEAPCAQVMIRIPCCGEPYFIP